MADNDSLTERQLLERLSIATQAAGIFVWEFDWTTLQLSWDVNRLDHESANRHFGQELGRELFKWVHPDDAFIGSRTMTEALAEGKADVSFRYRLRLADGSIRHIQAFARTAADEHGNPLRSLGVSWDITNEVEAAEQLRRNAEQERKLLAHLSIAAHAAGIECWEYDYPSGQFTWFHGLDEGFGIDEGTDATEIGRRVLATVLPEDAERVREQTERALAAGESSMTARMRRRMPDGRLRHVQLYQRFMRDESGRPVRSQGATRDITVEIEAAERFRAQADALRDAQRRLERASLSIHEGHWETDLLTGKHWASSSYYVLLGYDPAELELDSMEKVDRLVVHPDDIAAAREISTSHLESGTPYQHEMRLRHKDGTYRWFLIRGQAEKDASGRAIRLSGSAQDIHKQKLAESALQAARERFERAIRGTQDGLWEWDLVGGSLWVSPRFEAILGYPEGAISGVLESPDALVHPDDHDAYERARRAHFEQNAPCDLEVRMRAASGEYRWVRLRGQSERDADGRPLRLAGSMQDVTEARTAHDALIQASEAAQAASRSKSAFLANVSHEIRTPMNGIIGMTGLLLDTTLDGTQREYAETIHASASSLLTVINDILDFSKIEAGKLDIDVAPMDLSESVGEVRGILAFQAAAKRLRLEASVDPTVPRVVMGDRQRIRQCLINLVSNAIKFTHAGTVSVRVLASSRENGVALTRFEVRDSGIGIAPETLATLFQPFVQADSSTTRNFGGTGLGLSIVRRLVELMGGDVGVQSELGRGSTFWFVLPLPIAEAGGRAGAAASPGPDASPAIDTSLDSPSTDVSRAAGRAGAEGPSPAASFAGRYSGRVLLVEDNLINQKVARSVLERLGCQVVLAANGLEAVHAFAQARFDLVLLDLQMPLMDGYAATSCLRKLEQRRRRTPIIALTASAMTGQRERCLEAGMDDLLTKPLDVRYLQTVLERFGLGPDPSSRDHAHARGSSTNGGGAEEDASGSGIESVLEESAVVGIVAAPAEPSIDARAFETLTGGDAEFARELAHAFVHTSEEILAELSQAAGQTDRGGLARAAHSLKGASANIHARPLRALCADLESHAATLGEVELVQQVARIAAERQRVTAALETFAAESRKAAGSL